jgi:hypothetical protein
MRAYRQNNKFREREGLPPQSVPVYLLSNLKTEVADEMEDDFAEGCAYLNVIFLTLLMILFITAMILWWFIGLFF